MKRKKDFSKVLVDAVDIHQPLGRYLILLFRSFEDDLIKRLEAEGFPDVTPSDLNVLRFVKPTGSPSIEIARLAGISKQAVAKSVAIIEKKGYLKRRSNVEDGRSQIIVFTPKGMRLLESCIVIISEIEQMFEKQLGAKAFAKLKASLTQLIQLYD